MSAYLMTCLVVVALQATRVRAAKPTGEERGYRPSYVVDALCVLVLSAAPALRAEQVGTDTWMYLAIYDGVDVHSWTNTVEQSVVELGYTAWEFFCKNIGLNSRMFLAVTALAINGLHYWAIRAVCANPFPAMTAYVFSGVYLFQFNGMRQALAVALLTFGVVHAAHGKAAGWIPAILAMTVHQSAFVAVAALGVTRWARGRAVFGTSAVLGLGGAILALLLMSPSAVSTVTGLLGEKYAGYISQDSGSGYGRIAHLLLMLLVLWFLNTMAIPERMRGLTRFYSLGVGVQVVGLQLVVMDRLTLYFSSMLPILVSNVIAHGPPGRRVALWVGIAVYFSITLTRYGDLLPYAWSWR